MITRDCRDIGVTGLVDVGDGLCARDRGERHLEVVRERCGDRFEDSPDRGRGDAAFGAGMSAMDAPVTSGRVIAGDRNTDAARVGRGSGSSCCSVGLGQLAGDAAVMTPDWSSRSVCLRSVHPQVKNCSSTADQGNRLVGSILSRQHPTLLVG